MSGGAPVWLVGLAIAALCYFMPRTTPKPKVVGMDLGTTYSGVGVFQIGSGDVYMVPNSRAHQVIPSWVAFTPNGVLVGDEARDQDITNPVRPLHCTVAQIV